MKLVKCFRCKEKQNKDEMIVEENKTNSINKNGTPKVTRKYFHNHCYQIFLKEKEEKQREVVEFNDLFEYLKELHKIDVLDGRMIEKIQDLRNGSVKIKNKKISKSKQGVRYSVMLDTYKHIQSRVDYILNTNEFKEKWNEFSYIFGTMINNINKVQDASNKKRIIEKLSKNKKIDQETIEIEVRKTEKKDELDISDFL